jgi:hypothetical protein
VAELTAPSQDPALTLRTGFACDSWRWFEKKVPSSDGLGFYTVSYGKVDDFLAREAEFDWACSCKDFDLRRRKEPHSYCKHIEETKHLRCGWYEVFDPTKATMKGKRTSCPNCEDGVFELRMLVSDQAEREGVLGEVLFQIEKIVDQCCNDRDIHFKEGVDLVEQLTALLDSFATPTDGGELVQIRQDMRALKIAHSDSIVAILQGLQPQDRTG